MTRTLRMNDTLCAPGSRDAIWQVVSPVPRDGRIKLFNFEKHAEEYQRIADINDAIVTNRLVLQRKSAPRESIAAQDDSELEAQLESAMCQVRAIEKLQRKYQVSIRKAYAMTKEDAETAPTDVPVPSLPTIYRYFHAKRNGLPLLRGSKNKGNRNPRYDPRVRELIVEAANDLFLQSGSRWTINDLAQYVNDQARGSGLLKETQRLSREFVRKCIHESASTDPEIDRMDPKLVAAAKSIASQRIYAQVPFERVEQDAVHLPFVVQTAHGPTNNVYLTHAIDCCTSMPIGWHMTIGAPSESDGLCCVESIIFPKDAAFRRLGLQQEIDLFGTPHQLIFDNGPEARGERMRRLVRLGIDILHCKSRHAHGKPFIERLNRSLKEALQVLPGCTRMDGKDGQRDPIKLGDTLMSPTELERWVVRWYYESWANTPLKRHLRTNLHDEIKLGSTPIMRWKKIMEDLVTPLPLSPSQKEWRAGLYEHYERKLSRKTGVTYGGFNYRGENLTYLLGKYGERTVRILVNPDDYRQIFVNEGDDLPLIALIEEFVDETTPAYTFNQMKEYVKQEWEQSQDAMASVRFRHDVQSASREKSSSSRKKKSSSTKNRVVSDAIKRSAALRRANDAPLAASASIIDDERSSSSAMLDILDNEMDPLPMLSRINGKEMG